MMSSQIFRQSGLIYNYLSISTSGTGPDSFIRPGQNRASFRYALTVWAVLIGVAGSTTAQTSYTFIGPTNGNWGDAANWSPAGGPPNSTTAIAVLNNPSAYTVNVNGSFTTAALQFGANQTGAVNVRDPGGAGTRQLTLVPGAGSNGSLAEFNGRTTLFVDGGPAVTHVIRPIVFLGGGSAGNPVHHVWEIQGTTTVQVTGQIRATSSSRNTLTKAGTGTLTLTANNFGLDGWNGGLTIAGGTVLANNTVANSTGVGPVTVNGGGTLSGMGRVGLEAGAVFTTINAGGTLLPGTAAATPKLEILSSGGGGLTMNANSTLGVRLFGTGASEIGTVAVQGDVVVNTNRISLDLGGMNSTQVNQLRADVLAAGGSRTYRVLTATESLSGTGFDQAGLLIANRGAFDLNEWAFDEFNTDGDPAAPGGFVTVRFTPVPEPHAGIVLLGVAAIAARWRRAFGNG